MVITPTDAIISPELLYKLIDILIVLLIVMIADARWPMMRGALVNLEYFFRVIMGFLSLIIAFMVSNWFANGRVIYEYAGVTWSVSGQDVSILFLLWGILAVVYTAGIILLYISEKGRKVVDEMT